MPVSEEQAYKILEETLKRNTELFGAAIAFLPGGEKKFSVVPYVYRTSLGLKKADLGQKEYSFETKER